MNDSPGAPQADGTTQKTEPRPLRPISKAREYVEIFMFMTGIVSLCGYLTLLIGIALIVKSYAALGGGLIAFALVQIYYFVRFFFKASETKDDAHATTPRRSA